MSKIGCRVDVSLVHVVANAAACDSIRRSLTSGGGHPKVLFIKRSASRMSLITASMGMWGSSGKGSPNFWGPNRLMCRIVNPCLKRLQERIVWMPRGSTGIKVRDEMQRW